MEEENREDALASLFPAVASQMRGMLSTLYLAASSLVPADQREKDPELDRRAALLDQSYYQMLRLVGDLNAAARLDHPSPLTMQDCDLVLLVRELYEKTEALVQMLGLTLEFRCDESHLVCAVQPESIRQLLYHLLSNALKFTPAGGAVTLELKRAGKQLLLSVADTGCGMDELRLKTLFDRYRHKELMDPNPHGLGLGLAICRCIAKDHGGVLLAESREGAGSRFTLRLPQRQSGYLELSDVPFDYSGGFNRVLLGLADALPAEAFHIKNR